MKYIDLHCDALTNEGVLQVTAQTLRAGGCALQCFAAFIRERDGRFSRAMALCDRFDTLCKREGFVPVTKVTDLADGEICAMLTVEEGGAIEGSLEKLESLYARGVRMMTLTWNAENELGFPNGADGGLTPFGRAAVWRMKELGMLADVSHGSDRLVLDVAETLHGAPFVASHSNARAIFPHPRNLGDGQIRLIAESGGVVGLNFYDRFLGADGSADGLRRALLAHARHIVHVGGEDVLALGSDFDGIPADPYLKNPAYMPAFLAELEKTFGARIAEKIAFRNALRVLGTLK